VRWVRDEIFDFNQVARPFYGNIILASFKRCAELYRAAHLHAGWSQRRLPLWTRNSVLHNLGTWTEAYEYSCGRGIACTRSSRHQKSTACPFSTAFCVAPLPVSCQSEPEPLLCASMIAEWARSNTGGFKATTPTPIVWVATR